MQNVTPNIEQLYAEIARPGGGLAMVAIDQRESLRTMFADHMPQPIRDETLVEFKTAVANLLAPHASAMLFDRLFGWPALETAKSVAPDCGIIVSADRLIQEPGQAVTDTDFDRDLDLEETRQRGAAASKFLVIWKGEQNAWQCRQLCQAFMLGCRQAGLLGIIEAIVRPPDGIDLNSWDREEAILEAAKELGSVQPDLYKAEVPLHGTGPSSEIQARAEAITTVLSCPWVVLSSGVEASRFPAAVEAACKGGASGFLAGRGVWRDAIRPEIIDYQTRLTEISVPKLQGLGEIVDNVARPWREALRS